MVAKLYILNTMMVPLSLQVGEEAVVTFRRVSVEEAQKLVKSGYTVVSAVGHEPTARLLSSLLSYPVAYNRIAVTVEDGDTCLHFKVLGRLPEGQVIGLDELEKIGYELYVSVTVRK